MNTKNPNENEWEQCELNTQPRDYESLHGIASPSDNRDSLGNPTPPAPAGDATPAKSYKSCQPLWHIRGLAARIGDLDVACAAYNIGVRYAPAGRWITYLISEDLPAAPGTYALSARGRVIYVGQSDDLRRRMRDHVRSLPSGIWLHKELGIPVVVRARLDRRPYERLALEKRLIARLRPSLNIHLNPSAEYKPRVPRNLPAFQPGKRCKLTPDQVRKVFRLRAEGWTLRRIGTHFGMSHAPIRKILTGQTWKRLTVGRLLRGVTLPGGTDARSAHPHPPTPQNEAPDLGPCALRD